MARGTRAILGGTTAGIAVATVGWISLDWVQARADAQAKEHKQSVESPFRAGEGSLNFNIAIDETERRGEAPRVRPMDVKRECWKLLEQLRNDGRGLKPETERNIESYFTVADAFEADGLLQQSVDDLTDLKRKLEDLLAARAGRPNPNSLIETEDDLLHFRDAHSLHVIDGKYMTGAQPTGKGYRWLKSKGVTTIINLRVPSQHERQLVESLGMRYVHIPWADERAPTIGQAETMLRAASESEGRVFQHCLRGIGRDMTMAAVYRIATLGESASAAIARGREEAPRWERDQKRDPVTSEPVQFRLIRDFDDVWRQKQGRFARDRASAIVQESAELIGTPALEWTVTTWVNSKPLSLAKLRGKVVLLRWWTAPGCPFCEASAPRLSQWHERYAQQGLVVIGMYHPKPPGRIPVDVVKKLAQGLGMTFPVAIDPDWETLRRYWLDGRERAWTSVSFLIDQEGIIRYVHPGGSYSPEEAQDIEAMIRELLNRPNEADV